MAAFKQIDRRRYSEQVVESIKAKILANELAVGDKLPTERELIQQFNVSRTVVREAIRVLEESGFVKVKRGPKGGVFVAKDVYKPVNNSLKSLAHHGEVTIDHLFDVRMVLEPYIASEAAKKATVDDIKALQALIEESISHQEDVALLKKNNIEFHLLLARAAGNPVITILMESIIRLLVELSQDFYHLPSGKEHAKLHQKILSFIEEGNAEEASALMKEDISGVRERLKSYFLTSSPRR